MVDERRASSLLPSFSRDECLVERRERETEDEEDFSDRGIRVARSVDETDCFAVRHVLQSQGSTLVLKADKLKAHDDSNTKHTDTHTHTLPSSVKRH